MRHRHYAPNAHVVLVDHPPVEPLPEAAFIGIEAPSSPGKYRAVEIASTLEDYAHELFDFMRRCDTEGVRVIYCQQVGGEGLGPAIMDRLQRAAESRGDA